MKQILMKNGNAVLEDVPAPQIEPDTVLVAVTHSCISVGTELTALNTSGTPLWKKALKDPRKIGKALEMVASRGVSHTANVVKSELEAGSPVGYSAAGVIVGVGENIESLHVGQGVACAGAQCAHHAELIRVPENLTSVIPDGLAQDKAATVTLGAIALQGVRRLAPTLGETMVVVGLGVLGQIAAQLLRVNGCRVIGVDLERRRVELAQSLGMQYGFTPAETEGVEQVWRLTDGQGADGVLIAAASPADSILATSFQMCRRKGRVVLVGDVGLDINRADIYRKELDFFISTSYGPGRYDQRYEEQGLDYPLAYVRWTENRNMAEYLRLLAEKRIDIEPLIHARFPLAQASAAYRSLTAGDSRPLMVLLDYPKSNESQKLERCIANPSATDLNRPAGAVRIAVIGVGSFAKAVHLPNLQGLGEAYKISAVVSRSGHNAKAVAKQFGASIASTDYQLILEDKRIDAVLISTRHNLHGRMVLDALEAGKHVIVEKPLTLAQQELDRIQGFYERNLHGPCLLTGYNRRFSPHAQWISKVLSTRTNPIILNYRMNAGYVPSDHWVHGSEGGGRNLGEACHIYDLFTFFTEAKVSSIHAYSIDPSTDYYRNDDNFVATLKFADGSVANLLYTALGSNTYPKEQLEVFVDGKVLVLNDYRETKCMGVGPKGLTSRMQEKGHREELVAMASAIKAAKDWPIPLWQQLQTTQIALDIQGRLAPNNP